MINKLLILKLRWIFASLVMLSYGCSSPNPDAPGTDQTHPPAYVLDHGMEANIDLNDCAICHGTDFTGTGNPVPSCFSCHTDGPPFGIHSLPYTDPADHGPVAKADQRGCRACHGEEPNNFDGGIVADPSLFNKPAGTCSAQACHPAAKAHPTNWEGTNEDLDPKYDSSHRNIIQNTVITSCSLCHKTDGPGPGPMPKAPSCFSANFTNSDGITSGCHSDGPTVAPHGIPFLDAELHGPPAKADLAECQECHGNPGTTQFDGGSAATSCATAQCHPAASAHPTNWQGTNDITPNYISSHRNAGNQNTTCTICHDFTLDRPAPDPKAPSCFSVDFTNADGSTTGCHPGGPEPPHELPFTDAGLHGPSAKADLTSCQKCHAQPFDGGAGSNPQFNVPLGQLVNGCEDCHAVKTAHPLPLWSGAENNKHKTAGNLSTACALCHGANLQGPIEGGVGRACADCHKAGNPLVDLNCTSCHNDPPDSAFPAGDARPNRSGSHGEHDVLPEVNGICISCHNGAGTDTPLHYDESQPADVLLLPTYAAKTGTFAYNAGSNTCSGVSCHGGQQTPDWLLGTLEVDTDCLDCHQLGTSQFNSYNSGKHKKHLEDLDPDKRVFCTDCHDTAKLASGHFVRLDTPVFEIDPADTILSDINYDKSLPEPTCTFGPLGRCHDTTKHEKPKKWF